MALVREELRQAHVNVVASDTEGFPKVLLEGMAHGAIPVCSDFPAADLLVDHGRCGLTFARGSPEALADAIRTLSAEDATTITTRIDSCARYAGSHTLEDYGELVAATISRYWGV